MNEPKQDKIRLAIKKRWPATTGIFINHRKHTALVTFGGPTKDERDFMLRATSHAKLLKAIEDDTHDPART